MTAEYFAPEFRVELKGATVAADVTRNITDVSVTLAPDAIDSLRLTLANPYPALRWTHTDDGKLFCEGTPIKVWMGYAGAPLVLMFDGELTGMTPSFPESGSSTLELEGFSRLQRLQRCTRTITLKESTDAAMVQEIARASGLSAEVDAPELTHGELTTGRQPHLDYLLARAEMLGCEVWVEGTTLHFAARRGTGTPAYTLVWGRTSESFARGSLPLQSFSPQLDTRLQVSSVVVRGQHPDTRAVIEGRAGPAPQDLQPGGELSGARAAAALPGGAQELVVVDEPVTSSAEADARARALYDARASEFIQGSGSTLGIPGLRPGTVVRLDGLGRFSGRYYVTRSTHTIGGGGYRTSFGVQKNAGKPKANSIMEAVKPSPAQEHRSYDVRTALVTNNEDREKLGRVKLRFPWLSDEYESDWVSVARPMAGDRRGTWLVPEVDDEVLVVFEGGELSHPYVVGSLWSKREKNGPPPAGAEAGSGVQMLRSRSGHVVRLDDREGEEKIEITDGSGSNSIVIDTRENAITLTCQGDLTLQSGGKVLVKAAGGIEVTSDGAVQVEAGADMGLQATGAMKMKGSTIDLN